MALAIPAPPIGTRTALVTVEARVPPPPGFPDETWAPLMTRWMQKVDLLGTEQWRADQLSARYDVRFVAPYEPALDPEVIDVPAEHRLVYRGRQYDIVSAAVIGRFEAVDYRAITHSDPD
jgi:Phage head-tail joining protein